MGENLCQNLVVLETLAVAGNLALQREQELASSARLKKQSTYVDLLLRQILVGVQTQL